MKLSIVIIGDEVLLGQVTDTNSGAIARMLGPQGWQVVETRVVGDDAAAISGAVAHAMSQSDLVITTGGLGPTKDDITKTVLTDYFGGELITDPTVTENIGRVFARRGLQLNDLTRAQAIVPSSCRVIQNELGTAPIMWFEKDGKVLVAMPGVPFETEGMLHRSVADAIRRHFMPDIDIRHHTLIVSGITESDLATHLAEWECGLPESLHLAYLPTPGYIRLRLDGAGVAPDVYDSYLSQLRELAAGWLIHDGDATPAGILIERLRAKGLTVATAESCTGGNIAHQITSVAGCSDCYMGSVVSYSNDVKERVLGVRAADIESHGAVSEPVVLSMARGAASVMHTQCAIATSGIAGPGGGTPDKPVGTVWMAVHTPAGTVAQCRLFAGDRDRVIARASAEAIMMLICHLKE
ncbi:MAG: nicotinamide-nucleotide amidohydrolase family protein [Muribaculaceae bacterium]|nr:nicotinamide-nucleotide amidohydrolase family protein [Muribaculaceae bacterium]